MESPGIKRGTREGRDKTRVFFFRSRAASTDRASEVALALITDSRGRVSLDDANSPVRFSIQAWKGVTMIVKQVRRGRALRSESEKKHERDERIV